MKRDAMGRTLEEERREGRGTDAGRRRRKGEEEEEEEGQRCCGKLCVETHGRDHELLGVFGI